MNPLLYKNTTDLKQFTPHFKSKAIVFPKLYINPPGDQYEQEADAMADKVMRMHLNENNIKPVTGIIGTSVQRKCTECEEEEKKKKFIMRKSDGGNGGIQASDSLVSTLNSSKGNGSPLPTGTRSFMENAFSTDFSGVRVHTGSQSSEMSERINAKAFTYGSDIYFNSGQYNAEALEGKKLLAHELTHTIQQKEGVNRILQRAPGKPTKAEQRQATISKARTRAFHRVSLAYLRINGTSPQFNEHEELKIIQGLIAPDIVNFDQIVEIVGSIMTRIGSDTNIEIGPEIKQCKGQMGWVAYVTGNRLPIHLCERFFKQSEEQQVRTLIHEAAHAVGIGQPEAESTFTLFDCSTSTDDNWLVADAWARYINCISGQKPDAPQSISGGVKTP